MGSEWVGKGCVFLGFCNEMMKTYVHGIAKLHVMVLAASAVVLLHFVLARVAREEQQNMVWGVGLGSEWGRNGLESVVFSVASVMK